MTANNMTVKLWNEVTEAQAEAINGGAIIGNFAFVSKLTDQANTAAIIASGNASGSFNSAGVTSTQVNVA
jgi:hypothetical protein